MSESERPGGVPRRILLTTDLGARCDRAVARAVHLAEGWKADLVAVHCLAPDEVAVPVPPRDPPSWCRPTRRRDRAERRLRADLEAAGAGAAAVVIEEGDPVDAILRTAGRLECGLIVTGAAQDGTFWSTILGTPTDGLLSRSGVPVLIVRGPMPSPYRRIVVAVDVSMPSRRALDAALRLFPGHGPTIFHAFPTPFDRLVSDGSRYRADARAAAAAACGTFLAEAGLRVPSTRLLIEHGQPDTLLHAYARDQEADLVVLGSGGRSAIEGFVLGRTARRILDAVECDCLVVGPAHGG